MATNRRLAGVRSATGGVLTLAGLLAVAGCSKGDPAPASVASAPGSDHGAPAGHGMPSGHEAPAGHGADMHAAPAAHDANMHGAPAAHDANMHGAPAAHDANMHGAPAAHDANMHGAPAAHGGSPPGAMSLAHDGPAGHAGPAAHGASGGGQVTTAQWLGSLFGGGDTTSAGMSGPAGHGGPGGAHGAPGMNPDGLGMDGPNAHGAPGFPGMDVPTAPGGGIPGGGGQVAAFDEHSAEHVVQQLVLKLQTGDAAGAAEYISPKARSPLAEVRDGTATPEVLNSARQTLAGVTLVSVKESGSGKTLVLRSGAGVTLTFTAKREEGGYKVTDLKAAAPRGR